MSAGRIPTTANSPLTAKGDLFSFSTAPARLAVGSNGDTIVADSSQASGLRYQTGYNGNAVINGAFDIWQRGTSFVPASYNYGADRFSMNRGATGSTVSRQPSGLTGFNYAARVQRDSGNTSTAGIEIMTTLETADSLRFAGQTLTLSFYARAGANFSAASSNLAVRLMTGTGTDQPLQSFSGFAVVLNSTATLTTSYARYSYTVTLASSVTEFGVNFLLTPVGTAGAADNFDITGIQIELGSVATTFKRSAGGSIQGELAACQRYFCKLAGVSAFGGLGAGFLDSATAAKCFAVFPVEMRTTPSATSVGSTWLAQLHGSATFSSMSNPTKNGAEMIFTISGGTTGRGTIISSNNDATVFMTYSAEL